ncbi:MAG: hypothetical protein FWC78_08780 [Defluviitaleaceae bacterium]|nr:hypothetical protein [Defluviitaleaceae bacterium]
MNKVIKWIILAALTLAIFVVIVEVGNNFVNTSYTNFCDLRNSKQAWISQTIDITDNRYRLGGIGNIGMGSTRQDIVGAIRRRNILIWLFYDNSPRSNYRFLNEPHNLPGSIPGFYRARTWSAIEFLFDENDRVTKIRITPMH